MLIVRLQRGEGLKVSFSFGKENARNDGLDCANACHRADGQTGGYYSGCSFRCMVLTVARKEGCREIAGSQKEDQPAVRGKRGAVYLSIFSSKAPSFKQKMSKNLSAKAEKRAPR